MVQIEVVHPAENLRVVVSVGLRALESGSAGLRQTGILRERPELLWTEIK